jgi:hypothetical protein
MVDMSGSTRGWINEAEREALVLLCEALELLGDRYAIYGFSGTTRKRCELFRIKTFDEPYGDEVKARISGIRAQEYTRMGFAMRHLTKLLNQIDARTKVLVTLSDGRPDDYFDVYRGQYGIEDTRMALLEAARIRRPPVLHHLDRDARDYLPHMYGAARYIILDDVRQLPVKVTDIYRRIPTHHDMIQDELKVRLTNWIFLQQRRLRPHLGRAPAGRNRRRRRDRRAGGSFQGGRRHLPPQEGPLQPGGIRALGQVPGGAGGKRLEAGRRRRAADGIQAA